MKIGIVQTGAFKGDIRTNIENHLRLLRAAVAKGADVVIFPELSLTGYEPSLASDLAVNVDDARFDVFQQFADEHGVVIGAGAPVRSDSGVCIGLLIFQPQAPRQRCLKRYLHPDEYPFFAGGTGITDLVLDGRKLALAICYEIFVPGHVEVAVESGANIYLASVAKSRNGIAGAHRCLSDIAATRSIPVLMANCVGEADGQPCAGKSAVWNEKGELLAQLDDNSEGIVIFETDTGQARAEVLSGNSDRRS